MLDVFARTGLVSDRSFRQGIVEVTLLPGRETGQPSDERAAAMTPTQVAAPDTVTEAVRFLSERGYIEDFEFNRAATGDPAALPTDPDGAAIVDYTFRFEGPSDPADEAIVLGVRVRDSNRKGVIVSAFGSDADPAHARLLVELSRS
ncbi:MAG TPA: hypothetical protein VHI95_05855 [Acidimicrobiales bacterium]|jgi:hypothetical protein|nr:hypothetical protein [Acidimicrobiales bacterium]